MSFRIAVCIAAAACAGLPSPALAGEPADITSAAEARAEAVLGEAKNALAEPAVTPSRELTLVLVKLSQAIPDLEGSERRVANEILARPDDGPDDRYGHGFTVPEAEQSPLCDSNFCVHWVEMGKDAPEPDDTNGMPGVPDYVEEVLDSAADSYGVENATLDWVAPVPDGIRGGGGETDIYLLDIDNRYYGYASPDEGQGSATAKQAYLVLDDDYERLASPPGFTAIDAMQVTMAHEYNHVLQFAYDSQEDLWMFESTATWMEDEVYEEIDDYVNYLPFYARKSMVPLTANSGSGLKIYGAAVWNHYLAETGDPAVVRDAWAASDSVAPPHVSVAAYDDALGGAGSPFAELAEEFVFFAESTAEWRGLPAVYPDAADHPGMKRVGKRLKLNKTRKITLDHLAYALVDVAPNLADEALELRVKAPDGTRSGLSLIGRRGNAQSPDLETDTSVLSAGGSGGATLTGDTYGRVTAMAVNADARVKGSGRYKRDDQQYKLKLVRAP
ncbi:MAG: MXAN_6640 family putative metalloprotease [bacterium]